MSIVSLFLFPTIVSLLSQIIRKKKLSFNLTEFLSWCFFSTIFVSLVFPLFYAFGQISVEVAHDGLPMFSYTKVVPLTLLVISIVMGIGLGRNKYVFEARFVPSHGNLFLRLLSVLVRLVLHAGFFILIFFTLAYFWAKPRYFNINLEEVFFYLNMPLQGTEQRFTEDLIRLVIMPCGLCMLLVEFWVWFPIRKKLALCFKHSGRILLSLFPLRLPLVLMPFLFFTCLATVYTVGNAFVDVDGFISSRVQQSNLFSEEYVDPERVSITFPEKKRNLICIYVESAETTSQDISNGGIFEVNYIPEMTQIALDNVSFSQSNLLHGASIAPACGWTMAGLVAETAGIPLKFYTYDGGTTGLDNQGSSFKHFLPGATTLGDILEKAGYQNVFLAGSDFVFGGRMQYYSQHGNYEVFDLLTAKEKGLIPPDYMVGWGFEDEKLYQYAKDMLTELSGSSQPFNFSMLTLDTHAPFYSCRLCPPSVDNYCGRVLSCASAQLNDFIEWCKEQPFYENTTIAIMGDHASIVGEFYDNAGSVDIHHGSTNRLVYNAFINAAAEPVQEKNRMFTTMDLFPTTLASLGVSIKGDRLALGTNLFSDQQTLSEKYGYETLFSELEKKSIYYNQKLLYP